jgi:hypothetical protein
MESLVRCLWFLPLPLVCLACSDGGVRSGTLPETADFLPMAADTAAPLSPAIIDGDTLGAAGGEQPRLVLRCEEGRLGAYLMVGTPAEAESGQLNDRAVPVWFDSAPSC